MEMSLKRGKSQNEIALLSCRDPTTIGREIKCNTGKRGYRHGQAHRLAQAGHQEKAKSVKMTDAMKSVVSG